MGEDWPQFLGAGRDGVYRGEEIAQGWWKEGPAVLWQREVGAGFAGPVVAGGKLILFHRVKGNEVVECMESATGKVQWASEYPTHYRDDFGFDEGPRAAPAVVGERVYTFGAEGMLNCWKLGGGKNVWAVDTQKKFSQDKGYFGIACAPLVEGEAVVLNIGGKGAGIVAFGKEDGKVLWQATDDEAGYSSPMAATIGGKRYILSLTRAGLVVLDPKSGKVFFEFPWRARNRASVNAATPLVVEDQVFISASYQTGAALLKFKEEGPEKIWASDEAMSNHYATCVYLDGMLYGFHGRTEEGPSLRCVEMKSGKVKWSEEHFGAGSVILAGKQLVVLGEHGELTLAAATPEGFKVMAKGKILEGEVRAFGGWRMGCCMRGARRSWCAWI